MYLLTSSKHPRGSHEDAGTDTESEEVMKQAGRWWPWGLLLVLVTENAWLVYPRLRDLAVRVERDPIRHGREVAATMGCFSCHGPSGMGGVPNPGSEFETVPGFREQTPMMFVHDDDDIREYILDGAPAAKRQRESYRKDIAAQAIRMPAFRGWMNGEEVEALVAYIRASSGLLLPDDPQLARGEELMRKNGCFGCHGEMGSGGLPNPGSFKGYVPGFIGPDFADLVRNDEELKTWIREGNIPRLTNHPIASRYLAGQRIQMPAYKTFLSDWDVDAVAAYVRWLSAGTWRTQRLLPQ
jgi:mono/diheme cytochrome c family protein